MERSRLKRAIRETLSERFLAEGGIADRVHGQFRTDSTAWGILALQSAGEAEFVLEQHRARLVTEQHSDGCVSVSRQHPDPFWPTALAILAWQGAPSSHDALNRAVAFLLNTPAVQYPRTLDSPFGHDTLLKGWPWVAGTHSWIEPTALAIIALKTARNADHERVHEAVRLILDRQLPHGGWNYGNTVVFGRTLHPAPDSTGAALTGLAGLVAKEKVANSLAYLQGEVERLRTPVSLGWALLGLAAWECLPANDLALVERCLGYQTRYGDYETSALCLLLVGALGGEGRINKSPFFVSAQ
jgi:hypothetical protein